MSEYTYPYFSEDKKVICQVCGKPYLVISPRHLQKHNITYDQYKLRYPEAPLSCDEFAIKGKYGKEKQIFVKDELEKIEDEILEEIDDPIIEDEIDFNEVLKTAKEKPLDVCANLKDGALEYLQNLFTNIQKDYMIQIFDPSGRLEFETITDFADPVLKINIEFPKAFWHNTMNYVDANRNLKLSGYGWKVITINSTNISLEMLNKKIKESI